MTIPILAVFIYVHVEFEEVRLNLFWIGLVSLFDGISTFVGYLIPKPFSKKNSSGTI